MRLTHLKLAGFKSFVDPTTIHLDGQRVGVVGPNGCGKSNVMESVRWVLGESSAKEMRADAMDAVIFNGSGNRKPISRASVELIFDNSLGGASGEWSQYAEIAVKRVIERQKGSTYYINNTAVRRRDVADLFLGTGLGGRAYAIIGQNTISRIVEAKPEELRIYLEEAAGISKYKERRRETELRLRDTRENLTRVEDICRELQKQITKLESQAVVTQKYHSLQDSFKLAEGQFWVLKKRDASQSWEETKTKVEQFEIALEAQAAALRKSESGLESTRQAFYEAGEAINTAQAAYYEANAEVANLENQLKQNADARERMTLQLKQLEESIIRNNQTNLEANNGLKQLGVALTEASNKEQASKAELDSLQAQLPGQQAAFNAAVTQLDLSAKALLEANQRVQLDSNHVAHLKQTMADNQAQADRLETTMGQLVLPDATAQKTTEAALMQAQQQVTETEQRIQTLRDDESQLRLHIEQLRTQLNQEQRAFAQAEAEANSLEKIQASLKAAGQLSSWLNEKGLGDSERLWQKIQIDPEWSDAVEAVLGQRLNALISQPIQTDDRPPEALVLGFPGESQQPISTTSAFDLLVNKIRVLDARLKSVLQDWLAGCYVLPSNTDIKTVLIKLAPGECFVNMKGDILSPNSIIYHGADNQLHGVVERQQQLASLQKSLPDLQKKVAQTTDQIAQAEQQLMEKRQAQQQESQLLKASLNTQHEQQLALSRFEQQKQNILAREQQLKTEITQTKSRYTQVLSEIENKEASLQTTQSNLSELESRKFADSEAKEKIEKTYYSLRDSVSTAEKTYQEHAFDLKLINNKIIDLENKVKLICEEKEAFIIRKAEAEKALSVTSMETLKANLSKAVTDKQAKETALSAARNLMESQEAELKEQEQVRMQHEQQLSPLRDQLEQGRLKEQEVRIYFEQCQQQLLETGQDEQALTEALDADAKASTYEAKKNQLEKEITSLGAVNLAAIEELESEAERKTYLDSQMQDLIEASETLENAINKIDKETREKLMTTFNEANQHFSELFTTLFGGGNARLELLGEEILDTGLQVFAQPPGKKNTTIQLLSGGEKALTALALVFALFRLNPAPFCLMDEVDAPLDDSNTERFCQMVKKMSEKTQFLFVSHNKITMEIAQQLIGVTMQESGVSRIVDVDMEAAMQMHA